MEWYNRKFRNAPNEMLSVSDGELGDFAEHLGDWCEGTNPEATLVTSLLKDTAWTDHQNPATIIHAPVLDLDLEHVYYESSTPGHAALLLNVALTWEDYKRLLDLLEELGIIQYGFAEASRQRGYSACRTPWTKKPSA